jgi:autonomous glycyl radical cofactor GrcA
MFEVSLCLDGELESAGIAHLRQNVERRDALEDGVQLHARRLQPTQHRQVRTQLYVLNLRPSTGFQYNLS